MTDNRFNPEKPFVIIAICIVGLINAVQMLNLIFSPMAKQTGAIYPLYFSGSIAFSLVCIIGLWMMKRWAAMAYIAVLLTNQIVLAAMGYWEITAVIVPLVIILLLTKNFDKMT